VRSGRALTQYTRAVNPAESRVHPTRIDVRIDPDTLLPGRAWCAERPRALVAIVHGLGEHSGRYGALASHLAERRFTVVSLDLPGHGEAPGPRGDAKGWLQLRDLVVPAMFTVTRGMPGQPLDLPIVLIGHSMGGLLALDYALAHPKTLFALVLSAPGIRTAPPPPLKKMMASIAKVVAPGVGFPHGLDEGGISRDPEVLKARDEDPLVHNKISPRLYFGLEEARKRVLAEARRLAVPTLIVQGAADRVVSPSGALELNGLVPHGTARLITYRDA
jgi:acylglycerol lipase